MDNINIIENMLKSKVLSTFRGVVKVPKRGYERMSTEDYLINIRRSMTNTSPQIGKLPGLLEASKENDG